MLRNLASEPVDLKERDEMFMRKIKNGYKAYVTGNVVIRQKDGAVRSLSGHKVKVISGRNNFCLCDIGREKPIFIPTTNLRAA